MKRFTTLLSISILAFALIMVTVIAASAEDKILNTKIDSTTVALTKNGNQYVRFIVSEERELNGIKYNRSLPVMAFGSLVDAAKAMKAGDTLKAVVSYRKLSDGRESYTILSFIK